MSHNNDETQSELIDIRGLLAEYLKNWWLFLACIFVCLALAFLYSKIKQQRYQVQANIVIEQDDTKSGGAAALRNAYGDLAGLFGTQGNVEDEVFVVSSHSVLVEVSKDLGLNRKHTVKIMPMKWEFKYGDYPIEVVLPDQLPDTLMTGLAFRIKVNKDGLANVTLKARRHTVAKVKGLKLPGTMKTPYGDFEIVSTPFYVPGEPLTTQVTVTGFHAAAETLHEDVSIDIAGKKTNVISLSTISTNIPYAKDVLNKIVEKYNARSITDRNKKQQMTAAFIDDRLTLLTGNLDEAEKDIEQFMRNEGLTDLLSDATYNYTRKGSLETELTSAQAENLIISEVLDYARRSAGTNELMPSLSTPEQASKAVENYNNLLLQRIRLTRTSTSGGAAVKKLDEQIAAAHENLITTLEQAAQSSETTLRQLQSKIHESDAKIGKLPSQQRIYRNLARDQELKEQLYLFLLQRREETGMAMANATPKAGIVDEAYAMTEPLGMTTSKMMLIALMLGFLMAPAILYVRRMLRNKFESRAELEKITKVPLLGEVCTTRSGENIVVKPTGSSSISELFRLIRTNLQFVLSDKYDKIILMTSTVSGEGKSFIAINLAASLALMGKKVCLVGMDIRAPKLEEYLDTHSRFGVTQFLSSPDISVDDVINVDPLHNGMDVITAGPVPPNPGELLLNKRVDELFSELRARYDFIIVDSAPVGMVSDTFSLVRISDATVYVCRINHTSLRDVRFFNELYADERLHKMSLVVNGTTARKGYGYGYGHTTKDANS